MEKIFIETLDGYKLDVHIFKVKRPLAVVQIIHGMEEHQERYEDFIKVLNDNDFSVVSSDLRGHGYNCNNKDLGFFKNKDGYKELIADQELITQYIKDNFKDIPIYIVAHSFGTVITRVLLQNDSHNYQKVILSGYPNYQVASYLGIFVSNIIKKVRGPKYKSKLLADLSLGTFNKKMDNPKTEYDWICSNRDVINKYIEDDYCGIGFTCSAYNDLYHLVILMHKPKLYKDVNHDMRLLLLRGEEDPCTGFDKGAEDSYKILLKAGFKNIERKEYPKMRHEILGEKDNDKVYDDIISFFRS